jgi:hypothetical protein
MRGQVLEEVTLVEGPAAPYGECDVVIAVVSLEIDGRRRGRRLLVQAEGKPHYALDRSKATSSSLVAFKRGKRHSRWRRSPS